MIEIVSATRCINCNLCVSVCPTNVFDVVPNAPPKIARQNDCQTCFMCELYCPVDALYVAPEVDPLPAIDEAALIEAGLMGSYREDVGWGTGRTSQAQEDASFQFNQMKRSPVNGAIAS